MKPVNIKKFPCLALKWTILFGMILFSSAIDVSNLARAAKDNDEQPADPFLVNEEAAVDAYWNYYEACDRWGIQFVLPQFEPDTAVLSSTKRPSDTGRSTTARSFQQIRFVKPLPRLKTSFLGSGFSRTVDGLEFASKSCGHFFLDRFRSLAQPVLNWLEFASVENRTYPEFFLGSGPNGRVSHWISCAAGEFSSSFVRFHLRVGSRIGDLGNRLQPGTDWLFLMDGPLRSQINAVLQKNTVLPLPPCGPWNF